MKKTLIALAAFAASAASAATTLADAKINVANPSSMIEGSGETKDFSTTSGEYTMIFVLDRADTMSNLSGYSSSDSWASIKIGAAGSGMYWNHSIRMFKNDYKNLCATLWVDGKDGAGFGDRVLTFDSYTGTPFPGTTADSVLFANETNANETNNGKYALSLTAKDTDDGLLLTLGVLEGDGSLSTVSWTKSGWNVTQAFDSIEISGDDVVERMMVFSGVLTNDEIVAIATKVVPEPTTATLSLLALAGLAARRRRK